MLLLLLLLFLTPLYVLIDTHYKIALSISLKLSLSFLFHVHSTQYFLLQVGPTHFPQRHDLAESRTGPIL